MKILFFHTGSLGDTLAVVPAMWAVRQQFPDSHITLLSDRHVGKNYVTAREVLEGSQVVDEFTEYGVESRFGAKIFNIVRKLTLLARLRMQRFDAVAYLVHLHSMNVSKRIKRDRRFFQLAGIKTTWGMVKPFPWPTKCDDEPLPKIPSMSEQLLCRLRTSGINIPFGELRTDIGINEHDASNLGDWTSNLANDGRRPWIAVAPGTKMASKKWPVARFVEVVNRLIAEFDVWPVVFGGGEDQPLADEMIQTWQRGHVAAGALGVREAAVALQQCILYLGNDTGTMHLAASVGVPCVGIFSARDVPGAWYPLGTQHEVLRSQIDCEGCMLTDCVDRRNECLTRITTEDALSVCRSLLRSRIAMIHDPL
jgi:lipopolysaccharide heptosyltransferase III